MTFSRRGVLLVALILRPRSDVQRVLLALTWLGFTSGFLLLVYPITKEFGWPVGYDYEKYGFPVSQLRNHSGAINYPNKLDIYLEAELVRFSIAGPFLSPPFSGRIAISPLNSVPKKDLTEQLHYS